MQGSRLVKGFTIVELLIVIVVIAILASITIVSYNNIQQRARNTQTITAVKDYQKIYISFATVKGSYPASSNNYCLGEGYAGGLCWDNRDYTANSTVNTLLKEFSSTLPNPSTQRIFRNNTEGSRAGILFVGGANRSLRYQLEGSDTDCGISTATRSFNAGVSTGPECNLILPDPANL